MDNLLGEAVVFYLSCLVLGSVFVWAMVPAIQILALAGRAEAVAAIEELEQQALEAALARVGKGRL